MDLKPENVLITQSDGAGLETVKLADFGIAILLDERGSAAHRDERSQREPQRSADASLLSRAPIDEEAATVERRHPRVDEDALTRQQAAAAPLPVAISGARSDELLTGRTAGRLLTLTGVIIGTAESFTTTLMKTHTNHGDVVKVAVGYVRVSSLEQASEGVSLDVQRDKIRAYCKFNWIKLIDIMGDEGVSGSTLDRPGLQYALRMLKRGRANTLIVIKLDRLTRSVRDLCLLVDDYFAHERYHLLSVCGMANTHNAAGRMLMLYLANYAQFEREIISERTYEAMQHLKAQGVKMGHPPYGYVFSQVLDEHGRRSVVPLPTEQALIERMAALHDAGLGFADIARQLTAEGVRARRGGEWRSRVISVILQREGRYTVRPHKEYAPRVPIVRDKAAAAARARELRAEGLSLRAIGARLRKEGLLPPRARTWHAATVQHLLRYYGEPDIPDAARRAAELRAQGLSLSEIGLRLSSEGHVPNLGMHRRGRRLYVAVEWRRCRKPEPYSIVEVSLEKIALRWWYAPSPTATRQALQWLAVTASRRISPAAAPSIRRPEGREVH